MRGVPVKTPERVAEARRMRADGMLLREIAAHFGVRTPTVHTWLSDPDGSRLKARKDSYRGNCVGCGKPTSGCNGPSRPTERCVDCHNDAVREASRCWILGSFDAWEDLFGRPPTAMEWSPTQARAMGRRDLVAQYKRTRRQWPCPSLVMNHFGSWNAGVAAAGLDPTPPGAYQGEELWTPQRIVKAMQRWATERGETPRANEWDTAGEWWPHENTVIRHFGSWNAGVAAAGLDPRPQGWPRAKAAA